MSTRRRGVNDYGGEEYRGYNYRNQDSSDYKTTYENSNAAMSHYKEKLSEIDPQATEALEHSQRVINGQNADQICLSYKRAMAATEWQSEEQKMEAALGVARESFQPAYEDLINTYPEGAPRSVLDGIAADVRNFVTALLNDAADIIVAAGTMLESLADATGIGAGTDYVSGDLKAVRTLDDSLTTGMRPSSPNETPEPQAPELTDLDSTSS